MHCRRVASGALALTLSLAACGDPVGITATERTISAAFTLFALSSSVPTYPSALDTPFARAASIDAGGSFDVAFDFDSQGRIVVYPVRLVVNPLAGVNSIGLQKVEGAFEQVDRAPRSGFVRDSALVVSPGEVVVIEAQRVRAGDYCSFALAPNIYSKIVVDSVDRAAGTLTLRLVVDPNCGFRSFAEGIPRD